jgi:hypothetical protein
MDYQTDLPAPRTEKSESLQLTSHRRVDCTGYLSMLHLLQLGVAIGNEKMGAIMTSVHDGLQLQGP